MHARSLLLVALIGTATGLMGSRVGDALVRRSERTIATRIDHRAPGDAPPAHTWGEDIYQTFHPGSGINSASAGKNNFGARRWTLYKRSAGQIGGADRIVVYNNSPGDGIARSAVVFGVAPTNATGDEGVELDRAEIWNFGQVPTGKLATPARRGDRILRVQLDRSDHSRFLGEQQLVVLTGRAQATQVSGMDQKTHQWHAARGRGVSLDREFSSFAFALETSAYKDRSGAEVMDWLEAHPGAQPNQVRTVHISQGRDIGAPPWYSWEGNVAHTLEHAPGPRTAYTAPAFRIGGLKVPTLESGEAGGGVVEIVLTKPLTTALPSGEHVQMHSGGPPHATFFGHQLAYCRRGGRCYGNQLTSHFSSRPLEFAYASHAASDLDFNSGFAFETTLRSRFSRSAVEHWYEADGRGYNRKGSDFATLRAEQGWGVESYGLFNFLGRKTRLEFDSKTGALRLHFKGKRYRLEMVED